MKLLQTLACRARQFGYRRSIAVYLVIVVALVLASELAIEHILQQGIAESSFPVLNALAIAALVGIFVFFLFQGAVEDRERAGVALAASEERFRNLTALSADWFWETDAAHRLSWIAGGQSMLKIFGAGLAYGQRLWEIKGIEIGEAARDANRTAFERHEPFHEFELCRPQAGREPEFHLISGEPRFDAAGNFLGYRGVGRDVTERKRAEKALSGAKERLDMALGSGTLAIWDSDLATGSLFLSEGWAQLLGESPGAQIRKVTDIVGRIHVLDREASQAASRRAVKGESESFSAELRLRTASGDWKWVVSSGRVVERDAQGRAVRLSGTVVDIDRRIRAEHAMRDAEARYRTLVDLSPDAVMLQSDRHVEYANRSAAEMFGVASASALIGRDTLSLVHPDDRALVTERARYLRTGPGKNDFREQRMLRQDGSVVFVEGASVSYLERGRLVVQTVLRDNTERVKAREALAAREQRFRDVVEAAGEYVWETDAEFRYSWLSDKIEGVLGFAHIDLLGRKPQEFMPLGEAATVERRLLGYSERCEPFRDLVHRSITKSGRVIWQRLSGVPVLDADGGLKGYRGTGADITAKKQAEERIQFLATRDALTGLPNRLLLADRAGQAILNTGRNKGRIAVLSLRLDRFRLVNDSLGHLAGDALIRAVAERLANTLRKDDTLARLGGEEFVLLWDGTRVVEDVALVAQKVVNCLAAPIMLEGRAVNVATSIGISVYPGDGGDFVELLKNADAARHAASEAGGNSYRFYSRELNTHAIGRLELESDLHRALERNEMELHYQPIVRSSSPLLPPRLVGAEVLLRWRHPVRGVLEPKDFYSIADQAGMMDELVAFLVERASERMAAWRRSYVPRLWFSINVPIRELSASRGFARTLAGALQKHKLEGSSLSLEIADRSVQLDATEYLQSLREIAGLGVALTIDDFGTAQFNLAALRQLPVRKLKIDRSFVADLATRDDAAVIVQTFAAMAKGLGLSLAADGVDNAPQLALLRSLGCEEWQGDFYSEPLQAAPFERLLAGESRAATG